jgi:tRNA (guanine37-N1)-methyltransferase
LRWGKKIVFITILTLFPEIFPPVFNHSIIGRAQKKGLVDLRYVNIRDFATDKHRSVDDKPYGGGVGMIMRVDVVARAIESAKAVRTREEWMAEPDKVTPGVVLRPRHTPGVEEAKLKEKIVLLDPKGKLFNQATARRYSKLDHLILVCGHYEGIDERVKYFVDETVSIGKYILTGGEIPAMVITDSMARLIPGVLSKKEAVLYESFHKKGILEYPQFTRPKKYKGYQVPDVLLSGNHQKIKLWREEKMKKRPF